MSYERPVHISGLIPSLSNSFKLAILPVRGSSRNATDWGRPAAVSHDTLLLATDTVKHYALTNVGTAAY